MLRAVLFFYVFYLGFWLNEMFFRKRTWREHLWGHMRFFLFVIDGACQHSGNCCRSLMLVRDGVSIDTMAAYDAMLKKTPEHRRFVPIFKPGDKPEQQIHRFRCTCLTADNLCSDYANRPKLCHQYPMSMFIKVGYIHSGCGYKVRFRGFYPYVKHPVFWSFVFRAMRDNRLSNEQLQSLRHH
jgi:uncharacterized protein